MQIGTNSNDVAWEPTAENGFDQEMLDWYREYVRLHLRLWPYEWTLAQQITETGHPIQRPLGLQFPDLGTHPDDIYMFGPDLLVAPVVERGARSKEVVFPPGAWVDWFNGEKHEPGTRDVAAPLGKLPLFQRVGSIVPLLRPTIDTLAPTGQPGRVDSYATTPGVLYPRVAAGEPSSIELFDGTMLGQEASGGNISLSAEQGSQFVHGFVFELVAFGDTAPASVTSDGATLPERDSLAGLEGNDAGWFFDAADGGRLFVKVPAGDHAVEITR